MEDIEVLGEFFDVVIIPDVRFLNEIDKIKDKYKDAILIRVERPDFVSPLSKEQQSHKVETTLDDYKEFDYCIINNDTVCKLEDEVRKILIESGDLNESK